MANELLMAAYWDAATAFEELKFDIERVGQLASLAATAQGMSDQHSGAFYALGELLDYTASKAQKHEDDFHALSKQHRGDDD